MALEIYNTLSRKKEVFTPVHEGRIGMYFCGPTVYGDAHVGHAKAYITADIVNRYLRFRYPDHKITYVQNITDVGHMTDNDDVAGEDKLLVEGAKQKKHPMEIAEFYTRRYYEDMDALNVLRPDIAPRATGHIIEQIELIKKLIEKGYAYEVDGNVYFDVSKDHDYGKLSGRKTEDQEASGRVEARTDKHSPNDFALWKRAEKGHILRWPSPWGDGFPGWHIECSAMAMKYLGETIDIHGAGLENQFPHNECEIAQSECVTGKPFVKYWMHNNMVTTGGVKMGKSLGNAAGLRDLFKQYDPLSLRFTLLQSHYRSTTEFTNDAIESARTGYERLLGAYVRLKSETDEVPRLTLKEVEKDGLGRMFIENMDSDFSTAGALSLLFNDLASATHVAIVRHEREKSNHLRALWETLAGDILGILPAHPTDRTDQSDALQKIMPLILRWRKAARDRRDFAMSDTIRKELDEAGVILEDSKEGTTWRLK
jgi:cysteinyl-tRNA synthetase